MKARTAVPRRWRGRSRWGCLLMRKRYIQINGELREVCRDYVADPVAPTVWGDLHGYRISGDRAVGRGRVAGGRLETFRLSSVGRY